MRVNRCGAIIDSTFIKYAKKSDPAAAHSTMHLEPLCHHKLLHARNPFVQWNFFFYAKKWNLAAATTLPTPRAFQRAVASTGRRFFGPTTPCTSSLHKLLHARNPCVQWNFFFLLKKMEPSCCNHTPHVTGFPTSRRKHRQALFGGTLLVEHTQPHRDFFG